MILLLCLCILFQFLLFSYFVASLQIEATLAAFLLGFYTSLTVSRWWRLRTDGVGNIWSSASQLRALDL